MCNLDPRRWGENTQEESNYDSVRTQCFGLWNSHCKKKEEYAFNRMNFEHSTWTTRFLLAVLPRSYYKLDNGRDIDVFQDLLSVLTQNMRRLYETGVKGRDGNTYFFAPIRIMGDWPFIVKAGCLGRSFSNAAKHKTASKDPKGICHRCKADLPGFPWEDFSEFASWKDSINTLSPFLKVPALLGLLVDPEDAPAFFEFDLFHTWHLGIGRTVCASAIVVFAMSTLFQGSVATRLETVTNKYLAWCTANKIKPVVRRFTKDKLSWEQKNLFPQGRWSKGEATTVIMKWLGHECRTHRNDLSGDALFIVVCDATHAINQFLSGLYREDVWIKSDKALFLAKQGDLFLRKYGEAVRICFNARRQLFMLMPNMHRLSHITDDMTKQAAKAAFVINPLIFSCQADEDFVGRPSRVSRRVSILQVVKRTLLRSLECAYSHYVRAGLLILNAVWNFYATSGKIWFLSITKRIWENHTSNIIQHIALKLAASRIPAFRNGVLDRDISRNGKSGFWAREAGYLPHHALSRVLEGQGIQ